jgi:putative hydrolase of the HAD superfamily
MSDYDAIVVDFGGVMTTSLYGSMEEFAGEAGIEVADLARAALSVYAGGTDQLVVDFETGKLPEAEFEREFGARLSQITGVSIEPEGLVKRIFAALEVEEDMFSAIDAARRAGVRTGLLSNSWGTSLYPRRRLTEAFDVVVISGEVGLRKPDRAIFDLTAERLGVPFERTIFVDDHPGHLKAAVELGMTTVLHRSPVDTVAELESLLGVPLLGGTG